MKKKLSDATSRKICNLKFFKHFLKAKFLLFFILANVNFSLPAQVFELSLLKEICFFVPAATVEGISLSYDDKIKEDYTYKIYDKSNVNSFDRFFMHEYSSSLDFAGDIVVAAAVAAPYLSTAVASYFSAGKRELFTNAVMFAESMLIVRASSHAVKNLVQRKRPFLYYRKNFFTNSGPSKDLKSGDAGLSFFSAHSAYAFATATFATYTFWSYYPESPWRFAILGGSYSLAAATGVLRVMSGNHFATDVLTGAGVGILTGFLVPFCHKISTDDMQISFTPLGISLCKKF